MPPKQSRKRRKPNSTAAAAAANLSQQKKVPSFALSKEQQDAVKESFDVYADCGQISVKRAKHALREALNMTIPKDEIRAYAIATTSTTTTTNIAATTIVSKGNNTGTPFLDWTAFVRFATSKQRQNEKSNHAFSLMDSTTQDDPKGFLSIQDVARVAAELGEELTEEEMEEMMREADLSGDGLVVTADALFRIVREVNL